MAAGSEPETEVVALVAEEIYSLAHEDGVLWAEFSPDGERIVTASKDGTARVWSAHDGQMLATLRGHRSVVVHAAFSPDSQRVVTASMDHTARVWDVITGNETGEPLRHADDVTHAAFSPDGSRIVSTAETTAKVWDATSCALLFSLEHPNHLLYAEFSPIDGSRVVTVGFGDTALVWSTEDGRQISKLRGYDDSLWHAAFSPDGMRIVTGSMSGTPKVFDAATGRRIVKLEGHKGNVLHVEYSPDGRSILTAATDGTTRLWNPDDGEKLAIFRGSEAGIEHAAFSLDSRRVVTASKDGAAYVWDVATSSQLAVLRGHEAGLLSAAFSPDGNRIVTTSFDGTALVWSIRSRLERTVVANGEQRPKGLEEDAEPLKTLDAMTRTKGTNKSPRPSQANPRTRQIAKSFLGGAVLAFLIFLGIHFGPYIHTLVVDRLSPVVVPESHFVGNHGKNKKLLVFVHGVMGDMDNTWVNAETHASWPQMIADDNELSDLDVFVYGYATPAMGDASTIQQISIRFLQQLKDYKFFEDYKEVDFVTHSMGGIITKRALVMLDTPTESPTLQRVHTVIFISVPSNGADLAALASWISNNPQFKGMSPKSASDFLQSVESDWANLLRQRTSRLPFPRTFSAYETLPTGPVQVVPALYTSELSDGWIVGFDYNHINIVKPKDREAEVYRWVKARLLEKVSVPPTAVSETKPVLIKNSLLRSELSTTSPKQSVGPPAGKTLVHPQQSSPPAPITPPVDPRLATVAEANDLADKIQNIGDDLETQVIAEQKRLRDLSADPARGKSEQPFTQLRIQEIHKAEMQRYVTKYRARALAIREKITDEIPDVPYRVVNGTIQPSSITLNGFEAEGEYQNPTNWSGYWSVAANLRDLANAYNAKIASTPPRH